MGESIELMNENLGVAAIGGAGAWQYFYGEQGGFSLSGRDDYDYDSDDYDEDEDFEDDEDEDDDDDEDFDIDDEDNFNFGDDDYEDGYSDEEE